MKKIFKPLVLGLIAGMIGAGVFGLFSFAEDQDPAGSAVREVTIRVEYIPAETNSDIFTPEKIAKTYTDDGTAAKIAQVIWAEARGLSPYHKSLVAWCILNRYDMGLYGETIDAVIKAPYQFAYKADSPVTQENFDIALDVLVRWESERYLLTSSGRTLPKQFVNFRGDGKLNWYTDRAGNKFSFGKDIYELP